MAEHLAKARVGSHPNPPEISNLEIRNTWSGNFEDPVAVRISLEVQCLPNTQSQLLNTKHSAISLISTSVTRVHSDHFGQSDQSKYEHRTPSPLFAFSSSVTEDEDNGEETKLDSGRSSAFNAGHEVSDVSSLKDVVGSPCNDQVGEVRSLSDGASPQSERPRVTHLRTRSLQETRHRHASRSTPPMKPPPICLNIARSEDRNNAQNLGKRSAADACLPSSASDTESEDSNEKAVERGDASHNAVSAGLAHRHKSLTKSPLAEKMQRLRGRLSTSYRSNHSSRSSRSTSKIDKPVEPVLSDASSDAGLGASSYIKVGENDLSNSTATLIDLAEVAASTVLSTGKQPDSGNGSILPAKYKDTEEAAVCKVLPTDKQPDSVNDSILPAKDIEESAVSNVAPTDKQPDSGIDSIFTARDIEVLEKSLWEHESWRHQKTRVDSNLPPMETVPDHICSQEAPTTPLKYKQRPLFGGTDGAADTESLHGSLHSDETLRESRHPLTDPEHDRMTTEAQSPITSSTSAKPGSPEPTISEHPTDDSEEKNDSPQPEVFAEPELILINDILFVKSPPNITPVPYKMVLTLTIKLQKGAPRGWSYLVIPGLPRLGTDEIGVLLFQIPANHGLEFRVTNLGRYKMVENCFLAELVYRGDIMIPLRRCNQNFYGIIKDFTVDQEIKAEIMPCSGAAEGTRDRQKAICIRYQAFCSVKLHNRCFCAEKCCVLLSIDGGPEGFFRTELDTRKTGLQVVQIAPEHDTPLGTSTLQIICHPMNYEMFCISWTVKLSHNNKTKASSWLPRVYPGPSGSNDRAKHYLRYTHLERGDESPSKNAANHHPGESSMKVTPEDSEAGLQTQEQPLEHTSHSEESGAADASPVGMIDDVVNTGEETSPMTTEEVTDVGEEARGAVSGVNGEEEIIQRGEDAIAGSNERYAILRTKGLVVMFCVGFAVGGMFTSVWLDNIYVNALSRSFRGSSQSSVMHEGRINLTSEVSSVAADENHFQQMFQLGKTASVGGDVNLPEELTEQESADAEVELEGLGSGTEEVGEKQQPLHPHQTRSFRDQVDYWLGWRGPIVPNGDPV
ncbi:uncharacterized protein BO72DRAFT_523501 [Aspergillus fijiensis CBS 313.89]|uniref:Uncharacterized protein n=1 Tax=Aspergillus fijiensis CBS 313.89 TaxID=1448319 RepID=A0A8G1S1G4_9EURO|nr:uncharacterized protein BO72DRAFT_523501 [Aspergillus fijiensis CBS 313.89]RAK82707.1 hypothetical protein BO72DRAFT_523501 [Aspergillus fijiensis CBS 313.89]